MCRRVCGSVDYGAPAFEAARASGDVRVHFTQFADSVFSERGDFVGGRDHCEVQGDGTGSGGEFQGQDVLWNARLIEQSDGEGV
jgi:hypothetical protein